MICSFANWGFNFFVFIIYGTLVLKKLSTYILLFKSQFHIKFTYIVICTIVHNLWSKYNGNKLICIRIRWCDNIYYSTKRNFYSTKILYFVLVQSLWNFANKRYCVKFQVILVQSLAVIENDVFFLLFCIQFWSLF